MTEQEYSDIITNAAWDYLKKNHSPYGENDCQNAMNTAVLKAFCSACEWLLSQNLVTINKNYIAPQEDKLSKLAHKEMYKYVCKQIEQITKNIKISKN